MEFDFNDLKDYDILIFDFDGTLINSEPYNKLAHNKVLSLILNKDVNLTDEEYERYTGRRDADIFEMYKKDFSVDFDSDEMIIKKAETAKDLLSVEDIKIYDYFYELLKYKKDDNKRFYIVSNNHEKALFPTLENKGIVNYFDKIFCLPVMNVEKNYFYKNIREFIPDANKIVVFEDNANVLSFLRDLGYIVVAIQNEMNFDSIEGKFQNIISV